MNVILGWILIVLGILAFLGGLAMALNEQFRKKPELPVINQSVDLKDLAELVKNLALLLEQFAKLSVGIQWAILGLVSIAVGANMLP